MHPDTRDVAQHMKEFGLSVLGRAIYDSTFSEMMRPFAHALAVVHAAHGAEIVLKARIAQEHPLLIFSKLPSPATTPDLLSITELLEHARGVDYSELPGLLWAATGYRLAAPGRFLEFGRLRNQIVHFAVPTVDHSAQALKFCIEVLEPVIHDFWKESAVPYSEHWDEVIVTEGYLEDRLQQLKIAIPSHVHALFKAQ
jgi:hypothetical protein